jgi:hypothetical protein
MPLKESLGRPAPRLAAWVMDTPLLDPDFLAIFPVKTSESAKKRASCEA